MEEPHRKSQELHLVVERVRAQVADVPLHPSDVVPQRDTELRMPRPRLGSNESLSDVHGSTGPPGGPRVCMVRVSATERTPSRRT